MDREAGEVQGVRGVEAAEAPRRDPGGHRQVRREAGEAAQEGCAALGRHRAAPRLAHAPPAAAAPRAEKKGEKDEKKGKEVKDSHKLDEKETDKKRKYLRKQEKRGTEKKFIVELIQKKKDAGDDDTTEEAKKAKELAAQLARSGLG